LKSNNLLAHLDGKYRNDAANNQKRNNYDIYNDGDTLDLSVSEINSRKHRTGKPKEDDPPFVITSKSKSNNVVKANATSPELSSNYGNDDNSIKSLVSSISSKTISGGNPWLPHPNVMNKSNSYVIHKSDRTESWRDNMLMLNYSPVNPALTLTTVKCQDSVKEVFEMYSRKKYTPQSNRPLMPAAKKMDIKVTSKKVNK
jgi:hypothetical protein